MTSLDRQEIVVWSMDTGMLVQRLIAHFQVQARNLYNMAVLSNGITRKSDV